MRGIVLAGGKGTRLYPASLPISKILLSVYDKPMIYYPISTLMQGGIREILIITNPDDYDNFRKLLGDGSQLGVKFEYKIQKKARGIADAFIIAEDFIKNEPVALILGDNIFHGHHFDNQLRNAIDNNEGATVFAYTVKNPSQFGVIEFDEDGRPLSIEEKPQYPKSDYALTGLYLYDEHVVNFAKSLSPSARGELEITDLNKIYLENNKLNVEILGKGFTWLDTGTHDAVLQASNFIQSMEVNKGDKIACLEEIAINNGFIEPERVLHNIHDCVNNDYYDYIRKIATKKMSKSFVLR